MIEPVRLLENIKATFRRRNTYDVPLSLPPPPSSREGPFGEMAAECGLDKNLVELQRCLANFLVGIQR